MRLISADRELALTGTGLEDVRSAARATGAPFELPADDGALAGHLAERPLAEGGS